MNLKMQSMSVANAKMRNRGGGTGSGQEHCDVKQGDQATPLTY